ncbi:thermonuclease family protein, partial [Rhizobium sp. SEMIA 4085]|nr:thermonuclease family protein [Rhizobium sp. SEMIA 4085]
MSGTGGITVGLILALEASTAFAAPAGYFDLGARAVLETGNTWSMNGHRYRLYGVQSCLRGPTFPHNAGQRHDCG